MNYMDCFKEHYRKWFQGFSLKRLVEVENNLGAFIDSDLFTDCIISDEIIVLYELVRDECVSRISFLSDCMGCAVSTDRTICAYCRLVGTIDQVE